MIDDDCKVWIHLSPQIDLWSFSCSVTRCSRVCTILRRKCAHPRSMTRENTFLLNYNRPFLREDPSVTLYRLDIFENGWNCEESLHSSYISGYQNGVKACRMKILFAKTALIFRWVFYLIVSSHSDLNVHHSLFDGYGTTRRSWIISICIRKSYPSGWSNPFSSFIITLPFREGWLNLQ